MQTRELCSGSVLQERAAGASSLVCTGLKDAKASYYSSIISENALDPKILFNAVDKLLHRKVEKRYPTAPSTIELTNNFADFFDKKIATIRTELSNEMTSTIQSGGIHKVQSDVSKRG